MAFQAIEKGFDSLATLQNRVCDAIQPWDAVMLVEAQRQHDRQLQPVEPCKCRCADRCYDSCLPCWPCIIAV